MNPFQDVRDFHEKFGQPVLEKPTLPTSDRLLLRERLITEEYNELIKALGLDLSEPGSFDMPETADAIADLIYVLIGTAHELGIPLGHVWNAVQASNMAKEGGPTRGDGKILKPAGWMAPDIAGILRAHGWQP
jgi:predicted HAD superfamily Cof-like phosphohydrolase